ncbi:MAG: thymidine kinase [Phycisphaerae bacterium]
MSDAPTTAPGRLTVICGCMFAGKTAELIERLSAAQHAGKSARAFKHAIDVRYQAGRLATHDGRTFPAQVASSAAEIAARRGDARVVGIDEAQFFGRALVAVCRTLTAAGVGVIVVGIDHDAWGRPFPPLPELKTLANEVRVLSAPCRVCGRPARFSERMVPVTDPLMVGGPEAYEPRCEACFHPLPAPAPAY